MLLIKSMKTHSFDLTSEETASWAESGIKRKISAMLVASDVRALPRTVPHSIGPYNKIEMLNQSIEQLSSYARRYKICI